MVPCLLELHRFQGTGACTSMKVPRQHGAQQGLATRHYGPSSEEHAAGCIW